MYLADGTITTDMVINTSCRLSYLEHSLVDHNSLACVDTDYIWHSLWSVPVNRCLLRFGILNYVHSSGQLNSASCALLLRLLCLLLHRIHIRLRLRLVTVHELWCNYLFCRVIYLSFLCLSNRLLYDLRTVDLDILNNRWIIHKLVRRYQNRLLLILLVKLNLRNSIGSLCNLCKS